MTSDRDIARPGNRSCYLCCRLIVGMSQGPTACSGVADPSVTLVRDFIGWGCRCCIDGIDFAELILQIFQSMSDFVCVRMWRFVVTDHSVLVTFWRSSYEYFFHFSFHGFSRYRFSSITKPAAGRIVERRRLCPWISAVDNSPSEMRSWRSWFCQSQRGQLKCILLNWRLICAAKVCESDVRKKFLRCYAPRFVSVVWTMIFLKMKSFDSFEPWWFLCKNLLIAPVSTASVKALCSALIMLLVVPAVVLRPSIR